MRHKTDPGALLAGLYFLLVAGLFMSMALTGDDAGPELPAVAAAMTIGFSIVLLARILTRSRRRD